MCSNRIKKGNVARAWNNTNGVSGSVFGKTMMTKSYRSDVSITPAIFVKKN